MAELVPVDVDVEGCADAFLVQWSAYRFDLSFGRENLPVQGLSNAAITVHMSPQPALLLSRTLAEQMEAYERNVASLPVPVSSEPARRSITMNSSERVSSPKGGGGSD